MYFEICNMSYLWHSLFIAINAFFVYYFTHVVQRSRLISADGPLKDFLKSNLHTINEKYWPTFWCLGGGPQTLIANAIRELVLPKIKYRREILKLKDGGELGLHWLEDGCKEHAPCIIIIPGFIGHSQTEYIRSLVMNANRAGFRVVCCNYRGLGGVSLKTPRLYTLNCYEDLSEVIRHVREKLPSDSKLGIAAVSMGTLTLGAYLADEKEEASKYLTAAMMISPPCDLKLGMKSMEKPYFNRTFNHAIMREVLKLVKNYTILKKSNINLDLVLTSKKISDFITNLLVKSSVFPTLDAAYEDAKLHNKLEKVSVPLLCLCAADDIFQPIEALPLEIVQKSKNVAMVLTEYGGHIGFLEGWLPFKSAQYMERIFVEYFTKVLFDESGSFQAIKNN
ncbi:PREDICTED: phospholipase ABHD3-like [Rhagoletis zephyria]|uniref:phospholipase ABHD3-like n=1 Tax=Rhagoletis zephyria TaxID=28612 RepID=UPI0008119574|nr:PREDICTED: phospholipase ABHD3-like [Rhagoletis zephyria]